MTYYLLAGPATEPLTLAEAKGFLRVDGIEEDAFISTLISAARLHIESVTGRALIAQSWRKTSDDWPDDRIVNLPVAPLISLTAITAYDLNGNAVPLVLTQFQPETASTPACIFLPNLVAGMPVLRRHGGIEIDYVAGYGPNPGDVPADLRQAILSLVGYWFEHRDAVVIAGSGAIVPPGFDRLIETYRGIRL